MLGFFSNTLNLLAFVCKLIASWPTIFKSASRVHIQGKDGSAGQSAYIPFYHSAYILSSREGGGWINLYLAQCNAAQNNPEILGASKKGELIMVRQPTVSVTHTKLLFIREHE